MFDRFKDYLKEQGYSLNAEVYEGKEEKRPKKDKYKFASPKKRRRELLVAKKKEEQFNKKKINQPMKIKGK